MFNPQMMKAAQDMMSKMSPEEMNRMMELSKNMDPSMMKQAQDMMANPAMANQAAAAMSNMSADDMRARLNSIPTGAGAGGTSASAPKPTAVLDKLKASVMEVPAELLKLVEEAEGAKTQGNAKFKSGEWADAASQYQQGATLVDRALQKQTLTGADKQAVYELKDACHLNLANCRLKLEEWDAAAQECAVVLERGPNRKALFRRGQARLKQEMLQEALEDLSKAKEMDPSDATVSAMVKEVEGKLGIESIDTPGAAATPPSPPASAASGGGGAITGAGMHGMPANPADMERMLDQITPEQMQAQAAMLENMPPEQLKAMAPQFAGMDAGQIKMMSKMMADMKPEDMKNMAKMASQMQYPPGGGKPGGAGSAAAGASSGGAGAAAASSSTGAASADKALAGMAGMQGMDMANMDMDKGLDMMKNMSPEMMKAGMDMMKNMDPKVMASMSKMMGREVSEAEMERMKSMMDNMAPEDMEKWAGRAQKAAVVMAKPVAAYRWCRQLVAKAGAAGLLAGVMAIVAVMAVGHVTDTF